MCIRDSIIVGAGAAGVFAAYELTKIPNNATVLMIEKGRPLEAVSYTHLDVYKRQIIIFAVFIL